MATNEGAVRLPGVFRQPLSRLQAVIGITAGVISITGMLYSTTRHYIKPPIRQGDIVAVVHEAQSGKPVSDAIVEIYTLENRLVTTLAPKQAGRARQGVNEGPYNLRVSHPKFTPISRQVQVQSGQISEVRIVLVRPAPSPPPPPVAKITEKKSTEKKSTEKKSTEKKVPEKKAQEKKVSERKAPERKAPERKITAERKKVTPAPKESSVQKYRNPGSDPVQTN